MTETAAPYGPTAARRCTAARLAHHARLVLKAADALPEPEASAWRADASVLDQEASRMRAADLEADHV